MADVFAKEKRSAVMGAVQGKNTQPERTVRSLLHRMGYRFRLHRKDLPGKPDIVLPRHRKVVFVHGCFWHRHPGCKRATTPATNVAFWKKKLEGNVRRDTRNMERLRSLGWEPLVVWQCELKDLQALAERLDAFLGGGRLQKQDKQAEESDQ